MNDGNRQVVLAARPVGAPKLGDFHLQETRRPEPGTGEMLIRTLWLSLDPYMRGRMNAQKSYAEPIPIGGVIEGGTVSVVEASNHGDYAVGDIIVGRAGWQEWAVSAGTGMRKINPNAGPLSASLGVLGMPGMTAYTGLLNIGQPKAGETVVVAGASGAVGSVVGQIARIKGCRAVGVAGGAEKCTFTTGELGFDACIDHRAPDFANQLGAACPDGIDVYFENVGGPVLEAVFPLMNMWGRMPVCGMISHYNDTAPSPGPNMLPKAMMLILTRRLTLRGFIVSDYTSQLDDFLRDVGGWVREGSIRYREDVLDGLDKAPEGLIGLLQGNNFGKLVVKVAEL